MGNDRWASMDELKSVLTGTRVRTLQNTDSDLRNKINGCGPVLAYRGRRVWSYNWEGHSLFLGSTGTGKSRRGIIPLQKMILHSGESAVVVDPKMELYRKTYWLAKKMRYEIQLINFADISKSEGYNVFGEIVSLYESGDRAKRQTALDMVDELAMAFYPENKDEPFWINSARSVFKAVVIALLEYADVEEINLASVYQFVASGDERYPRGNTYLKKFVELLPEASATAQQLCSYITTANDTRAGIRSTFLEGLSLFSRSDEMIRFFSGKGLDVSALTGDRKTIVYICIPDRTPIYDRVCGVIIGQLMSHYIRIADEIYHGALPVPLHFIIDEFGNVSSALGNMPHLMSAGRSRGVRVHYVLQSLSQLTATYSPSDAKTILNNTDLIISFRTNDWETMDTLSKLAGERIIDYGKYQAKEPLMSPAKFQELDTGQAFVTLSGKYRFVTFLPDYEEIFDCGEWTEPEYPERPADEKVHLFDIKEYVDRSKYDGYLDPVKDSFLKTPPVMDDYVKRLDDIILDLEEQEKKEEERNKRREARKGAKKASKNTEYKYEVTIVQSDCSREHLAKALSGVCKTNVKDIMKKLETLPATFIFETEREALDADMAVFRAGGLALIEELE